MHTGEPSNPVIIAHCDNLDFSRPQDSPTWSEEWGSEQVLSLPLPALQYLGSCPTLRPPFHWPSPLRTSVLTAGTLRSLIKYNPAFLHCAWRLPVADSQPWGWAKFQIHNLSAVWRSPLAQPPIHSHGNSCHTLLSPQTPTGSCPHACSTILLSPFLRTLKQSGDNSMALTIISATCVPILTPCHPDSAHRWSCHVSVKYLTPAALGHGLYLLYLPRHVFDNSPSVSYTTGPCSLLVHPQKHIHMGLFLSFIF